MEIAGAYLVETIPSLSPLYQHLLKELTNIPGCFFHPS